MLGRHRDRTARATSEVPAPFGHRSAAARIALSGCFLEARSRSAPSRSSSGRERCATLTTTLTAFRVSFSGPVLLARLAAWEVNALIVQILYCANRRTSCPRKRVHTRSSDDGIILQTGPKLLACCNQFPVSCAPLPSLRAPLLASSFRSGRARDRRSFRSRPRTRRLARRSHSRTTRTVSRSSRWSGKARRPSAAICFRLPA